jgi:hypothetical protein
VQPFIEPSLQPTGIIVQLFGLRNTTMFKAKGSSLLLYQSGMSFYGKHKLLNILYFLNSHYLV